MRVSPEPGLLPLLINQLPLRRDVSLTCARLYSLSHPDILALRPTTIPLLAHLLIRRPTTGHQSSFLAHIIDLVLHEIQGGLRHRNPVYLNSHG